MYCLRHRSTTVWQYFRVRPGGAGKSGRYFGLFHLWLTLRTSLYLWRMRVAKQDDRGNPSCQTTMPIFYLGGMQNSCARVKLLGPFVIGTTPKLRPPVGTSDGSSRLVLASSLRKLAGNQRVEESVLASELFYMPRESTRSRLPNC